MNFKIHEDYWFAIYFWNLLSKINNFINIQNELDSLWIKWNFPTATDDALLKLCELLFEVDEILVEGPHERLVRSKWSFRRLLRYRAISGWQALRAVPHDFINELLESKHNLAICSYLLKHRLQTALQQKPGIIICISSSTDVYINLSHWERLLLQLLKTLVQDRVTCEFSSYSKDTMNVNYDLYLLKTHRKYRKNHYTIQLSQYRLKKVENEMKLKCHK